MEKFNLSWNNFDENILNSFKDLKYNKDFTDVTLVCEENKQVKAHKVVISSCGEFFKSILIQNPHQHPLVYLHGVSFVQLQAILNFAYLGQTQVEQQYLQSFLQAALKDFLMKILQTRIEIPQFQMGIQIQIVLRMKRQLTLKL